jgi:class 3 adenylate cyclase/tetratricopeptide (TPR) repeat protein
VPICAECGRESQGGFAFCPYCGAQLQAAPSASEQRKTVTVLFCDVAGSTGLGESTDPEALRVLLARYFERMKAIVESHGGTVEKFIGDAVMAVFGVPRVHEDDALRAVRAACEMRDALPALGLEARIGLDSGEVVTGTKERLVTGDSVNVAARLEQAARPGEILLGEAVLALARAAVEVEALEPLELKGKAEPVRAYRLVLVHEAPERRHETPFVGRVGELEALRRAWQRVCEEQRCLLVTVVGDAGLGKSRLTAELLSSLEACSVSGRCLPYGEGITYWPVVEVIKQLDSVPSDPAAAASLRVLLAETEHGTSSDQIAWAFRKLLEQQAQEQPLVCVFDDVQWGADTFLDLVEHVALLSTGTPILILCVARPELTERRPEWPIALRLEPLPDADVQELIPERLTGDLRGRITRASGGNPLFLTEMVAMATESVQEVVVPPTLQALLASRLDQLKRGERSVLERAAIEGEVFHHGAVQALTDGRQVVAHLASLVRKGIIRPDTAQFRGDDAFRFRHLLVRDAAYDGLPKALRAELHQRFAGWLEDKGEQLVELDEIVGFHLEQAARYKHDLGRPEADLAKRAGERLTAAGRRALLLRDRPAAAALLERALVLTRPLRFDNALELDLAAAQSTPRQAVALADAAAQRAHRAGDHGGEATARVVATRHRLDADADPDVDELGSLARAALPVLEQAGDHDALMRVWHALGLVANFRGHCDEWAAAAERAIHHSRLAGRGHDYSGGAAPALVLGPRPADEALRTLDAALPEVTHPYDLLWRAWLLAMLKRFAEAEAIANEASERLRDISVVHRGEWILAAIATLKGDHEAAAEHLRLLCDGLQAHRYRATLSTYAPRLGRSLCLLGRHDEGEPHAQLGSELGGRNDVVTQALWRQVQALVDAQHDQHTSAEQLAREAVAITERTDMLDMQGDALWDLADVLAAAGRSDEAAASLEQALTRYERKKNLAMVAQVKPKLEELRKAAPA